MFDTATKEQLHAWLSNAPAIIGESSLRHDVDDLVFLALSPGRSEKLAVVDDVNTEAAFGNHAYNALKGRFNCEHVTLVDGVVADDRTVSYLRNKMAHCDALIAVGSGTINDLCKYVASLDNKPYVVFPTAASMNGYLSANASITVNSHKITMQATLPEAVFCDFSVIANAPIRLAKSGLGDSLARPTAQADWLLSHLLLGSVYGEKPFLLLKGVEAELFENARGIAKNDMQVIQTLMKLLLLSGAGMSIAGGSYPASQGEHMIAHTYNMIDAYRNPMTNPKPKGAFHALHGEEIGIATLYMAKRQEGLLKGEMTFCKKEFDENLLSGLFGNSLTADFRQSFDKKQHLVEAAQQGGRSIDWDSIRSEIEKVMIPSERLEKIRTQSECCSTLESIGWNAQDFNTACHTARFTRNRFTFLDIFQPRPSRC